MNDDCFAAFLARNRVTLNGLVAQVRRARPELGSEALTAHFVDTLAPIVAAVELIGSDDDRVALPLCVVSCELLRQACLGPDGRHPLIAQVWSSVLPLAAVHVREQPRQVAASLSNAAYNIESTPGTDADGWLAALCRLAVASPSVAELLDSGRVAAWRCGMAQHRGRALDILERLEPTLAWAALGLEPSQVPPTTDPAGVAALFRRHRWASVADAVAGVEPATTTRIAFHVGSFHGFGGQFMEPPVVMRRGEQLVAVDGSRSCAIHVDAFNAVLTRLPGPPPVADDPTVDVRVDERGAVALNGVSRAPLPELAQPTSWAAVDTALAVTTARTHRIHLVTVGANGA